MKRKLIAMALTALALGSAPQAQAKIDSLGECYDAVITWCNEKHPDWADVCAKGGMDECDKIFTNKGNGQETGPVVKRLRLLVRRAGDAVPDYGWQIDLDLVATPPEDDDNGGARDPDDTPPAMPDPDDEPGRGGGDDGSGDPTGGGRGDSGGDSTGPTGRGG